MRPLRIVSCSAVVVAAVVGLTSYLFAQDDKTKLAPYYPTPALIVDKMLQLGELKAGETLLVLGASGGVGLAAVDIGKRLGARVIACASTAEKLAACRQAGADELINYTTEDLREAVKRITGGRGIDVCYDPVGDKYAEPMVRSMAWGGRYLVIGFAAGEIPKIALNLPLLKGSAIVGVFLGGLMNADPQRGREIYAELIGEVAAGRLKPLISASYPLERTVEALQAMATRNVLGKVVVTP